MNPFSWLLSLCLLVVIIIISLVIGIIAYEVNKEKPEATHSSSLQKAIVASIIVFCCSCWGISWWESHPIPLSFPPTTSDIVGIWVPTQLSLDDMKKEGGYTISTHTLTFKDDGTFEIINMPDWWLDGFGESHKGFYSGSGKWDISSSQGEWVIELDFDNLTGYPDGLNTDLSVQGHKPRYIYTYIGDPDSGKMMTYERSK